MGETRELLLLIVVAFVVGGVTLLVSLALPLLLEGNLVVDRYEATLHEDGTFQEIYTYNVRDSGQYRMLYRFWQDPLTSEPLDFPSIQLLDMDKPPGTVGYMKDWSGKVTLYSDDNPQYIRFVQDRAEQNEVGIYNPGYFPEEEYTVSYTYILHPPIEYDGTDAHLNLRLVDRHVPFRTIEIRIPERYAREIFPHPPGLAVTRENGWVIVRGNAAADETLGVEMLFSAGDVQGIPGFSTYVGDVRGKTVAANPFYQRIPLLGAWALYGGGLLMVFLTPFLLVIFYRKYGREKQFTVPEYLSFCPNPAMKPWAVNLLFKGDAINFDQDGYYATLLDLHRRKVITIQEKPGGKGIVITLNKTQSEEPYEQRVLDFLQNLEENGVVDSATLQMMAVQARRDSAMEKKMLTYQQQLAGVTRKSDPRLIAQYIVDGRDHLFPLLFIGIAFCAISVMVLILSPVLAALLGPAIVLWGGMIVQSGIALAFPSTLFGQWKGDRYKEKLQWDAFARFLSDLALIKQYPPADISMWGEWLVYGTALGVGEKVEKAMEALHINLPDAGVPMALGLRAAFIPVLAFSAPSHGGSGGGFGGGGSFGGGGGFGGGGVGGR